MEKITSLVELADFLKREIDEEMIFAKESVAISAIDNFDRGYESGYTNSYVDLLCALDPEYHTYIKNLIATKLEEEIISETIEE